MVADPANDCAAGPRRRSPGTSVNFMKRATRIGWAVLIAGPSDRARRARAGRMARRSRSTWSSPRRATRRRPAATSCDGGQRGRRGGRHGVRPGGHAPEAGNLGGGGFLVAYWPTAARSSRSTSARRRRRPADADGCTSAPTASPCPDHRAGRRAAGVPGTVRGLGLAHARSGKLPWADLVRPAVAARTRGLPRLGDLARSLNRQLGSTRQATSRVGRDDLGDDSAGSATSPESVAAFGKPDGSPWHGGDRLVQPDLAATLDRIAAEGPDEFYTGKTAELIAALHGRARRPDHAATTWRPTRPRSGRRCTPRSAVSTSTAWARRPRGGSSCQMLNILERYDLSRRPRFAADAPPGDRGDAPGLLHPGHASSATPTSSTCPSPS